MSAVYLYCDEDWNNKQSPLEPDQEALGFADSTGCPIYKFENGKIERAEVSYTEPTEEELEEDPDADNTYEVEWVPVAAR